MFIEKRIISLFRSVGAIFGQRFCLTYRTYGAKEIENIGYYKHIVPTGLRTQIEWIDLLKLTPMGAVRKRTISVNLRKVCVWTNTSQ